MKILTQHITRNTLYIFLLSLFLVACQDEPETIQVTVPVTVEVTRQVTVPANSPVVTEGEPTAAAATATPATPSAASLTPGSEAYPIQLLFPPTVPLPVLEARSEPFFNALRDATGFHYLLRRTETHREMLDLLCNEPDRTVAFMAPELYILAHEQCGAQAGQVFQRLGVTWNAGMVVVRNESPIQSLEDLNGQTWGTPGPDSRTGTIFFNALFQEMDITPGTVTEYAGESRAMSAVYSGEVAFATATFIAPVLPYNEAQWQYGVDSPELWRDTFATPVRSGIGYVIVNGDVNQGGYRLREARAALLDTVPGIFNETRIVALTPPIPFEAVVYGAELPFNIANEVAVAMMDFAGQDVCVESICAIDFLNMAGLQPVADSFYNPYREMIATLGWGEAEILGE